MSQSGVGHEAVVQVLHADLLTAGFTAQRWIEVVLACLVEKFFGQVLRALAPFLLPGPNHQGGVVQTQAFAGQVVFMARWVVLVQAWFDDPGLYQRAQAVRQSGAGNVGKALQLVEPSNPQKSRQHDLDCPAVSKDFQAVAQCAAGQRSLCEFEVGGVDHACDARSAG